MKKIFVTGSSTGFGQLITKRLLENGDTVCASMRDLNDRNSKQAESLTAFAQDKPGKLHLIDLDVTDPNSVEAAINKALEFEGQIDVLVNNAGVGQGGFTETFTEEQFQKVFDVNVFGLQRTIRAVLPSMREKRSGLIINISSIMGRIVIPYAGIYTASKYAVEGLSEGYRYELKGTGVDVVVVEPGGFATNFSDNMMPPGDEERVKSYGKLVEMPEKMWGGFMEALQANPPDPNEIAEAVVKLIETPAGQRPTRTVADPWSGGEGTKAINETTDQVQTQLMQSLGMGQEESV
ncbi:MAG: SDR family oxidoreductase [Cyclobacteriaceae bacterium]|nr:SDR family oxidoreductase [Cyclobacteriaceae bacterium]